MLCGNGNQDKVEKINERALRLAYSDYSSSYKEFLANSKETTVHIQSVRNFALEVYKKLNNLNPVFMKDFFVPKNNRLQPLTQKPLDVPKARTTNNGIRSIRFQGPKIWNSLPESIKTAMESGTKIHNLIGN